MPVSLLALALSAFAIGTTEFVIMGLLPNVANDLQVTIPLAGWLISGYALGVAIGAPIMAVLTAKLPRKKTLLLLMTIFIVGNLMCALSYSYGFLMLARVITALCHGAFFGIGAVVAANLVAPNRRASAVALMFTGLTLANVLGVPLGTALGQALGWRSTFWAVAIIGVASLFALYKKLPDTKDEEPTDLRKEMGALRGLGLWLSLSITVFFSAAMFALFTYIAPMLTEITGVSEHGVSWTLLLIGLGLTIGNVLGGRLADWRLGATLTLIFLLIAIFSALFSWTSVNLLAAEVTLFFWAMVSFAAVPALQINVVTYGKNAPNLVSTLNIAAFNVGNALGAWVGGAVIARGLGLTAVPLAAGALGLVGFVLCVITFRRAAKKAEKALA
ncbi:MAG: MFS transporter [Ewingella americana]|jgi:DHA1 family inner membrane transport protein|uniref:MFS transporter n=1 Tax=Ewingella americana TaxID=41202 RepID=UPI000C2F82A9|nr:MFS transporter [Ewingella americana]MCI1679335.1 MFS transporter [Ewingella americana]MCI1854662.1 MFS transporter [Ewingella americana]MCI1862055.1 MFS transporter [Ewingella americana]MCI2142564.1 MFS transporter [Ewingella americana]MCI2162262.1 MFS transporter [Ewingella americana]